MSAPRSCTICTEPGCEKRVHRRTLCSQHYRVSSHLGPCSVAGCTRAHFAKGFCGLHWQRAKRGIPFNLACGPYKNRTKSKPGDAYVDANGYRCVYSERGHVRTGSRIEYEHRLVMEKKLGRALLPRENVHHLDGDKLNNAPDNLELWTTSQPSGQRVEDKLIWARQFIASHDGRWAEDAHDW